MDPMSSYSWLIFALGTVVTWGLYGIFLHMGQMGMVDPVNGRYKAFFFVGVAYFLTAVLAPLAVLMFKGTDWNFPAKGLWLSLFAGILGAIGAFFVLLALGAAISAKVQNAPAVVMSIIFAGAPNVIISISMAHDWGKIRWPFILGLCMAAAGGFLVTKFKPVHAPPAKPADKVVALDPASPGSTSPSDSQRL
jgi:hypothetical protein